MTGVSGSGKSTIARQLTRMGRDAVSLDGDELLCGWVGADGRRVARPAQPDAAWLSAHRWCWDPARLDQIMDEARDRGVDVLFLCGHAANGLDLADRFDACLLLEIDRHTMRQRLEEPDRGNDFGRVGDSLMVALSEHDAFVAAWRRYGAVTVDATEPVSVVAENVLLAAADALHLRPSRTSH